MHCCHRTKVIQLCFAWWRWWSCAQMMRDHLLLRIPVLTALPCLVESPAGSGHCRWYQAAGGENGPTDGPLWNKQKGTVVLCGRLRGDSRESSGTGKPQERWCQSCLPCWKDQWPARRQTDQLPAGQHQSKNSDPGSVRISGGNVTRISTTTAMGQIPSAGRETNCLGAHEHCHPWSACLYSGE